MGICFDGTNIWVVNSVSDIVLGNVTKLRASDGTILGYQSVGTSSDSVSMQTKGICFDGTDIWVTNYSSNSVTKLSALTVTITTTPTSIPTLTSTPNPIPYGTYVYTFGRLSDSITLNNDGTYMLSGDARAKEVGTYNIQGNTIVFTNDASGATEYDQFKYSSQFKCLNIQVGSDINGLPEYMSYYKQ
jgi:hypothetical protein